MQNDELLVSGMFIKPPRDGAPDFVKGHISIKVSEAVAYLKTYEKQDGYVNLDILVSRAGKPYLKRDTWEPKKTEEASLGIRDWRDAEGPDPATVKF